MEDWGAIAADALAAIAGVGFAATINRATGGPLTPWDSATPTVTTYPVTVVDTGIKERYGPDGLILRRARVLLVGANFAPLASDTITLRGVAHEITAVMPLAPGGVDLMFEIEVGA